MYKALPSAAVLCSLWACNDPSEHFRMPPPSGDMGGAGGDGQPPPAGVGMGPSPGTGFTGGCMPTGMALERIPLKAGDGVKISGRFKYDGGKTGQLLVEAMSQQGNMPAESAYHFVCGSAGSGPFELEAPKNLGEVRLVAFIDVAGDGPSDADPGGLTVDAFEIGSDPVEGLEIVISDSPELGPFTPSAASAPKDGPGENRLADGILTGRVTSELALDAPVLVDLVVVGEDGTRVVATGRAALSADEEQDPTDPGLGFSLRVPPNMSGFYLVAFLDKDEDGPSPGDAAGVSDGPLSMDGGSLKGIDIKLLKSPDLSAVAYPFGAERPPEGAFPTEMDMPPGANGPGQIHPVPDPSKQPPPEAGAGPEGGAPPPEGGALPPDGGSLLPGP